MTVLLDTNFLLSAISDRSSPQQQITEVLFRAAAQRRTTVAVPQFILFEAAFVLRGKLYNLSEEEISSLIGDLTSLGGVEVVQELPVDAWLQLWPARVAGAVDAALAALSLQNRWPVATFDQRLARRLKLVGADVWRAE